MKEADKQKREMVDLKNDADTTIHTTEKSCEDHKANVPSNIIEEV